MREIVTAQTGAGTLRGLRENGLGIFRGIPYAAPPVRGLRWASAQSHEGWEGVRDAISCGPSAPQPYLPGSNPLIGTHGQPPFDEDCLTLNLWTPGVDDESRPVLLWIHGGGFLTGSGNLPIYAGDTFAHDGELVVVSINYRIGPLGFLHGMGETANLWLTDQIAALKWVQANIAAFGGNPDQITLAGQSGGAFSIGALAGHPETRDLFKRAILQSPPMGLELPDGEEALERTQALARHLGHDNIEALREEPWERLVQGTFGVMREFASFCEWPLAYFPVIDEATLPKHPADVLASSGHELVVGWTRDEASFAFALNPNLDAANRADVVGWLEGRHAGHAGTVYDHYFEVRKGSSPKSVVIDAMTDDLYRRRTLAIAESRAISSPIHVFEFEVDSPLDGGILGTPHCLDIAFSFANFDAWGDAPFLQGFDLAMRDRVAASMHGSFIAFARTGNPGSTSSERWPAFTSEGRQAMVFGPQVHVRSNVQCTV